MNSFSFANSLTRPVSDINFSTMPEISTDTDSTENTHDVKKMDMIEFNHLYTINNICILDVMILYVILSFVDHWYFHKGQIAVIICVIIFAYIQMKIKW